MLHKKFRSYVSYRRPESVTSVSIPVLWSIVHYLGEVERLETFVNLLKKILFTSLNREFKQVIFDGYKSRFKVSRWVRLIEDRSTRLSK